MRARTTSVIAASLLALAMPAFAAADRGDDVETRVRAACAGGSAQLRLRAREDHGTPALEAEVRIDSRRPQRWRIVMLHERALVYQGKRPATRSLRYRRTIPDWPGRETVSVRATTADGRTCRIAASI